MNKDTVQGDCGMVLMVVMMILLVLNLFAMAMLQIVSLESRMTVGFAQWIAELQ